MSFWGRSANIHAGIRAIHDFHQEMNRYPADTDADIEACMKFAKSLGQEDLMEDVVKAVTRFSTSSLCPLSAFFGGIVA